MSMQQPPQRTPGVGDFLGDAVSLVQDDPRIVGVTIVGGLLSVVPIVGNFLNILVVGFAHILAQKTLGGRVTQQVSLGMRLLYLLGASIVAGIAVLIGLIFLIIPGIYLALRFSLLVPAIMIDGHGPLDGISESWERAGGNVLTIFGFGLVVAIATIVLTIPLVFVFGFQSFATPGISAATLASGLVTGAIGAVQVAGLVLMYRAFGDGRRGPGAQPGQQPHGGQGQYQGGQGQYQGGQQPQGGQGQYQQGYQGGQGQGGRQPQGGQQNNRRNNQGNNRQNDQQNDDQW